MDHFKGISETERFNNDLLNEARRTNELLEQIAQLLKLSVSKQNEPRKTRGERK